MSSTTYPIHLIAHNIRSLHNVGSLFRLADCAGIEKLYLTGYTGYPEAPDEIRKPWDVRRAHDGIAKTALGAQDTVAWEHEADIFTTISRLKARGVQVCALEIDSSSQNIYTAQLQFPVAFIVGNEIEGVTAEIMDLVDKTIYIPMVGQKESLNVAMSAGIAVYEAVRRNAYNFSS